MKIEVWGLEDSEGLRREKLVIDGKKSVSVSPLSECPEDAIIGRDLISCCEIADLMKKAHAVGLGGEHLSIEIIEKTEDEFYD